MEADPLVCRATFAKDPMGNEVDLATGVFVDDIGRTNITLPQAEDAAHVTTTCCQLIDESLEELSGIKQNMDKLVSVPCLSGHGSAWQMGRFFNGEVSCAGKWASWARYLGPQIPFTCSNGPERQRRILGTKAAYARM